MRKYAIFVVSETYFSLCGPIPGNVTGSNPVPIVVWLNIYLVDKNILRKKEAEIQKKIFEIALYEKIVIFLSFPRYIFPIVAPYQGM